MKGNSCVIAAVGISILGLAASVARAETINIGSTLPDGPVPAGFAGFNWGNAVNNADDFNSPYFTCCIVTAPSATVDQFSSAVPFTFTGITFANLASDVADGDDLASYSTVISGYRGNKLVDRVTEQYPYDFGSGNGTFSGLDFAGVTKITFQTTAFLQEYDDGEIYLRYDGPYPTYVSSITVDRSAKAPELDAASAAGGLTFLLGCLLVVRGSRLPVL